MNKAEMWVTISAIIFTIFIVILASWLSHSVELNPYVRNIQYNSDTIINEFCLEYNYSKVKYLSHKILCYNSNEDYWDFPKLDLDIWKDQKSIEWGLTNE